MEPIVEERTNDSRSEIADRLAAENGAGKWEHIVLSLFAAMGLRVTLIASVQSSVFFETREVFFFLCFVALAAAAPQLIYPGVVGGISPLGLVAPRTLVAGPTVVNGLSPWGLGGRLITPGYVGPAII